MSLQTYRAKRDFKQTHEPRGKRITENDKLIFVVQEHHSSRLHWDFRLELDGVLKSWAVPKGPSMDPDVKRLAVQVEDHPLDYASFEGEIPKGNYGAGMVYQWDNGTWIPDGDPHFGLKKGHLKFNLKGKKLKGSWHLVRTGRPGKQPQWLLFKGTDKAVKKNSSLPKFVEPQLASLSKNPPEGDDWIHEIKYDGYRTSCRIDGKDIIFQTRSGLDWTDKYKELTPDFKTLNLDSAIIDGEIVCIDEQGKSSFYLLQQSFKTHARPLLFYAFDLLYLNGEDLRSRPLRERKRLLEEIIKRKKLKKLLFSDHWTGKGAEILQSACKLELEGIISKNIEHPYESGRGTSWLKIKCKHVEEFVIGGYNQQRDNSALLGSMLLGVFTDKGDLEYVGKVGTGYNSKVAGELLKRFKKLISKKSPFKGKVSSNKDVIWLKPELVANIEFADWTSDNILRHASFKGLREDKPSKEVHFNKTEGEVRISHPEKILFPKEKISKADLAAYYNSVQKLMMPFILNRPLALLRCPAGQEKTCFFQKHLENENPFIHSIKVKSDLTKKLDSLLYIDTAKGLTELVQLNTLEIHTRGCEYQKIDHPNLIVFDFDPGPGVSWSEIRKAAVKMKDLLMQLKLKSFVKVTGGKGLHVHVPIEPNYDWDQIKNFAKTLCQKIEQDEPDKFTTNIKKSRRDRKIFLDYLRNGYGATAITAYSVRATPKATVALPITWEELKTLKAPDAFNVKNAAKFLKGRSDPWPNYFKLKQKIELLE